MQQSGLSVRRLDPGHKPRLAKLLVGARSDLPMPSAEVVPVGTREAPPTPPPYGHGSGTPRARARALLPNPSLPMWISGTRPPHHDLHADENHLRR